MVPLFSRPLSTENHEPWRERSHLKEMQRVGNRVLWGMEEEYEREWWRKDENHGNDIA